MQDAIKELSALKLSEKPDNSSGDEKEKDKEKQTQKMSSTEEEKSNPENAKTRKNEEDEDDADWDEDDSWDDEGLSEEEMRVVPACLFLIKAAYGLLNGTQTILQTYKADAQPKENEVEAPQREGAGGLWFEQVVQQAAKIAEEVDEAAVSVYPPQKRDALKKTTRKLRQSMNQFISLLNTNQRLPPNARFQKMLSLVQMMLAKADEQCQDLWQ